MTTPRPGRRRSALPSMATLLPLLLLLFTSSASAASAVLGIDLGSSFIKAAIVKPGTPLDIVLTKDSKRKEASVVAFKPSSNGPVEVGTFPERLYGGDALALGGRFPGDVYTHLKTLLGVDSDDRNNAIHDFSERSPAIQVQASQDLGAVTLKSGAFSKEELPWSVEELLAMELKNIRGNAEAMTGKGSKINEAVITVPTFYTVDERRAIERAADLAGLHVMGLVSDGLAVGIDYAVKREFPNVSKGGKPEIHMVFDMGAASTTATILRFQGKDVKDIGRFNKTVQEVTVLGTGWDRTLGGNALNNLLVDHLVDGFTKKADVSGAEVRGHGRTASKLWREAERARQVLSANSDVRSSFEGLHNDIDFSSKLSRSEYETMAAAFAERIGVPFQQALDAAKLSTKDLDSVILHGGVVRTPFVQKKLEALTGKSTEIRSNVNADESAAFGAAFKAAGLSPSFKVKEIRDYDSTAYAAGYVQDTDSKGKRQKVFKPTSTTGSVKDVTFKNLDDFSFSIYQELDGKDRSVLHVKTGNLTASVAALHDKFGCSKDDITTRFTMKLSSLDTIPEVVGGAVSCEVEGSAKAGSIGDSVKGLFGFGSKKGDQEVLQDDEDVSSASTEQAASSAPSSGSSSSSANGASPSASDAKPKKRTETTSVSFTTTPAGLAQPASSDLQRMADRLAAFDRSDKARAQREEALNVLEAFTYRTRDLLTDAGFEGASTAKVRTQLSALLSSTSEWLSGEGATAGLEILRSKLSDLKALVDPVQKRREEAAARPGKVTLLETALNSTKSLMDMVAEQVAKADAASSAAAASSASAPESSTTVDDFADLEEPDTSSSATASPSSALNFSPYTNEDLTSLSDVYETISSWFKTKMAEQDKLAADADPVISTKDIEAKAEQLNKVMMNLIQKKVQMPKSSSSKKPKSTRSKSKKAKTSTGDDSETTAAPSDASSAGFDKSNFLTVSGDDEMPTEEEILEMVRNAKNSGSKGKDKVEHGEL